MKLKILRADGHDLVCLPEADTGGERIIICDAGELAADYDTIEFDPDKAVVYGTMYLISKQELVPPKEN